MRLECTEKLRIYCWVLKIKHIVHTQQRDYSVCDCFTTGNMHTISNDEDSTYPSITFDDHQSRWLSIFSFQDAINFVILDVLKINMFKVLKRLYNMHSPRLATK